MITNVYVDGFNLYYGCLKGTPHKWLDLEALCAVMMPTNDIKRIRYFTARGPALAGVTAGRPVAARDGGRAQPGGDRGLADQSSRRVCSLGVTDQAAVSASYSASCSGVGAAPVRTARIRVLRGVCCDPTNSITSTR